MYKSICGVKDKKVKKVRLVDRLKTSLLPRLKLKKHGPGVGAIKSRCKQTAKRVQAPSDKNFTWRGHAFAYVEPKNGKTNAAWSVSCPFSTTTHRSGLKRQTGCKRRRNFDATDPFAAGRVLLELKAWLVAARRSDCMSRIDHLNWHTTEEALDEVHLQDTEVEQEVKLELPPSPKAAPKKKRRGPRKGRKAKAVADDDSAD